MLLHFCFHCNLALCIASALATTKLSGSEMYKHFVPYVQFKKCIQKASRNQRLTLRHNWYAVGHCCAAAIFNYRCKSASCVLSAPRLSQNSIFERLLGSCLLRASACNSCAVGTHVRERRRFSHLPMSANQRCSIAPIKVRHSAKQGVAYRHSMSRKAEMLHKL